MNERGDSRKNRIQNAWATRETSQSALEYLTKGGNAMNAKTSVLFVLGFTLLSCLFAGAALAVTITVTINDGADHTLGPSAGTVDLTPAGSPATYTGFTIADVGAGARVTDDGVVDANDDVLHLRGTVITATAAGVTGKITFWSSDLVSGPTGGSTYATTAKGTLTRSSGTKAAKDSWIKISGYWEQPPNGTAWNEVGTQQSHYVSGETPVSYGTINKTTAETYSPAASNRGLKGYVEFFLKNSGDKLTFSDGAADGVRVRYAAPGGPGSCPPGLTCNEDPVQCAADQPPSCPEGSNCVPCVKQSERTKWNKFWCWLGWGCPACIIPDLDPGKLVPVDIKTKIEK
jgi:hypothetical protein